MTTLHFTKQFLCFKNQISEYPLKQILKLYNICIILNKRCEDVKINQAAKFRIG